MKWCKGITGLVILIALLVPNATAGTIQANTATDQSYRRLGHGRLTTMQWEVWGEMKAAKGDGKVSEEACVSVVTLEATEGNESTNCGSPDALSLEETVRSRYGVVAGALFAPDAKRVVICMNDGKKVSIRLKRIRLKLESARPTYAYSYFARGFTAGSRLKWMTALDRTGNAVPAGSGHRLCR